METSELIEKYVNLGDKYGKRLDINLINGDGPTQVRDGFKIIINTDKIPENELESYIAYNVRHIVFPDLVFETERLIIRPFQLSDSEDCFWFLSDKESCYNDGGYEPFTEMDDRYRELMELYKSQPLRKMIVLKETNKVIGDINITEKHDRAVETFEIGYGIDPSYRRCGYTFEALSKIVDCLLSEFHLDMIIAGAIEKNIASINLLHKLGFHFEGRKTKAFWHPEDGAIDLLYYVKERV